METEVVKRRPGADAQAIKSRPGMKAQAVQRKAGTEGDADERGPGEAVRRSIHPAGGAGRSVKVSVVYARPGPDGVWQATLAVPAGADVAAVLEQSGFAEKFPAYPIDAPAVGIFGRRCQLDEIVSDGDRVEVYRPLDFDPMASRRRRAAHRKAAADQAVFRPRRVRHGSSGSDGSDGSDGNSGNSGNSGSDARNASGGSGASGASAEHQS